MVVLLQQQNIDTPEQDKYLRSVADFRNLQERTKRDIDSARTFAIQRFASDLLDTIDNFDRALSAVPKDKLESREEKSLKDLHDLYDGLKMTENILMATLKKHGLERFDPSEPTEEGKTQKFDPNRHEATFMTKVEGKEDGDIMYTQSKGFLLNGRVVRVSTSSCYHYQSDGPRSNFVFRLPRLALSRTIKHRLSQRVYL